VWTGRAVARPVFFCKPSRAARGQELTEARIAHALIGAQEENLSKAAKNAKGTGNIIEERVSRAAPPLRAGAEERGLN
jgi:hypothetical protein